MRKDPVLILMIPRSGSSMVAGIFRAHKLWFGRTDNPARFGYASHENTDIKTEMNGFWRYRKKGSPYLRATRSEVLKAFGRHVPYAVRWAYKSPFKYWPILDGTFEDARYVFVRRPVANIFAALVDNNDAHADMRAIQSQSDQMDRIAAERGIPCVDAGAVVAGDYTSLAAAFEYAGVAFDPAVARGVIQPDQWKH